MVIKIYVIASAGFISIFTGLIMLWRLRKDQLAPPPVIQFVIPVFLTLLSSLGVAPLVGTAFASENPYSCGILMSLVFGTLFLAIHSFVMQLFTRRPKALRVAVTTGIVSLPLQIVAGLGLGYGLTVLLSHFSAS